MADRQTQFAEDAVAMRDEFPAGFEWSDEEGRPVARMWHSARETAERLGVTERTVRRWIASGDLAAEKEGGIFHVRPWDADAVFARSRAGAAASRGPIADRLAWLEAENERLWALLEKAVTHA